MKTYIVCAANKHVQTGIVIAGARHWDNIMCEIVDKLKLPDGDWEQGFVDQEGNFHNRKEAAFLVLENKQVLNGQFKDCLHKLSEPQLFSEHLY